MPEPYYTDEQVALYHGGGEHDPECEDRGRYDRFEGVDYCAGCGAAQS